MDLKEIQNLIKFVAKSGASEVKLEMDDIKITIKTGSEDDGKTYVQQMPMGMPQQQMQPQAQAPAYNQQSPAPSTEETAPAKSNDDDKYITIKSPNYRNVLQKAICRQKGICRSRQ